VRWPEVACRVALIAGAVLAVSEHASAWVTAPVGLIAIAATIELAIRPYASDAIDRVLIGCGGGVVGLILLGVGLNLTPWGLTRITWTVTLAVVGLGVLIWRRGLSTSFNLRAVKIRPSVLWALATVAVLIAAGAVAQAGVRESKQPLLALSLRSKTSHSVTVEIDATSISGTYRIDASSAAPGAREYASAPFDINAGASGASMIRQVPANIPSRWTITLASATGAQTRELIVNVGSAAANKWTDIWVANFTGPANSKVPADDWGYTVGSGGFGDGEVETMTNSTQNVHLDGKGDLVITPLNQNGNWTSGRVQSARTFLFAPGAEYQVTATIKQPDPSVGTGYWPAFWMVASGTPLHQGEIDVMENINGYSQHSGTFHCGYTRTMVSEQCEVYGVSSGLVACPDCLTGYQTYTVIIDRLVPGAEQISWYLDGREYFSVNESEIGTTFWNDALNRPFSIILEVGLGGIYPDSRCNCTSPISQTSSGASMLVRNVTVAKATT
jgi:Glycosyl hydrolases family 16